MLLNLYTMIPQCHNLLSFVYYISYTACKLQLNLYIQTRWMFVTQYHLYFAVACTWTLLYIWTLLWLHLYFACTCTLLYFTCTCTWTLLYIWTLLWLHLYFACTCTLLYFTCTCTWTLLYVWTLLWLHLYFACTCTLLYFTCTCTLIVLVHYYTLHVLVLWLYLNITPTFAFT
jgi:hypothetical protein